MQSRASHTQQDFVRHFTSKGVDADIAEQTWSALKNVAADAGFAPAPTDDLLEVFGLADEDLDDDIVLPLLQRCSCRIPPPQETAGMLPVRTVEDLVQFLQQMRATR